MSVSQAAEKWLIVIPPEGAARTVGMALADAFQRTLGETECKVFDTKIYLAAFDAMLKQPTDEMVVDLTNQSLVVQCLDFKARNVLVVALSPVTQFTTRLLAVQGITNWHWFIEDHRRAVYWKSVLPAYQYFLAIQKGEVERTCRERNVRFAYMPTAADRPYSRPIPIWRDRPFDLAFVGIPSPYRVTVLECLADAGLNMAIAGEGWNRYQGRLRPSIRKDGWVEPEEARALLSSARIGLHLSVEEPMGMREDSHVSPRLFDILQLECRLLAEASPLVAETLTGMDYTVFKNPSEAVFLATALLAEAPDSSTLRANRERVISSHLYATRVSAILGLAG